MIFLKENVQNSLPFQIFPKKIKSAKMAHTNILH